MAKPLHKERENRSAERKDLNFHRYDITPETAHTAILLLKSDEPEILCQTLRAITKFAEKELLNRQTLYNLDAIKYILLHIEHKELNIRRFALKALAQMSQLPRGPEQILADFRNLKNIARMLVKVEDIYVLEFASLVLSELTREPLGCEQLVSANILNSLCSRMKDCLDPDVQRNCLQTLSNLLEDPVCAPEVTNNKQFSWPPILALMMSKYLEIQHAALKTVDQLICRYKDQVVQKSFRNSTGVLDLCDILESYEFRDVHAEVLGVLRNYAETEENADHLYQSGCLLRLLAYLDMALPTMKPHCLAVLTKMSFTANGREALHQTGTDLIFCQQMLSSNVTLHADAAMGIANMTKLLPAAVRMSETNVIETLCVIVSDDDAAWFYIRMNSLRALAELCRIIPKAAYSAVEPKTFTILRNINKKYDESPIEAQRLAVQCFINLQNYHVSIKVMLNAEFMHELLSILQRIDIKLKIMTCTALSGLMRENISKDLFTEANGEKVVSDNLHIEHVGLRTALCTLICTSMTNESAEAYLGLGTIHYMVENKKARFAVTAWETALEEIFRHHPSVKFAYMGKLEINDYAQEGFYVQKRRKEKFPTLLSILRDSSLRDPVYISIFSYPPFHSLQDSSSGLDLKQQDARRPISHLTLQDSSSSCSSVPDDVNLRNYLLRLQIKFGDPATSNQYLEFEDARYDVRYRYTCEEVSILLKQRAQLLGEFVADQMCGITQEMDCSMPSVNLHLADLMAEFNSSVIGIGFVKCGGSLERAVLYKVLADRLGLPCALHRSTSAHAWCEVAVPEVGPDNEESSVVTSSKTEAGTDNSQSHLRRFRSVSSEEKAYPAGLVRANYVVDLVDQPGRLIPLSSAEVNRIRGTTG